jgi:hypothetical protein
MLLNVLLKLASNTKNIRIKIKHGISCIISGGKQVTDGETQAKQQTSEERL